MQGYASATCGYTGWSWLLSGSGSKALDQAYRKYFGAFGAAWDGAMVVRWTADSLAMLWPEKDAAFVTSHQVAETVGPTVAPRRAG